MPRGLSMHDATRLWHTASNPGRKPARGTRLRRWLLAGGLCAAVAGGAGLAQSVPDSARQAMQQGAAAMAAGDFKAAITAYTTVTRSLPEFAEGYFNLGLAYFQNGQLNDARAALEKALQRKPELRGANLFLGLTDYRENRFKEAAASLLRETRLDPHNAKAFMWLGVCRLAQDDPQGAIAPLDKAYALDPRDADILYHRGRAYFLVANASYNAMFWLDPDSLRVHQVLAEAYAQAYRNQEAINELEIAVKMAPQQPGLHEELADQFWIVGQLDKAAAAYREELRIDPYAASSMYKLGSLLVLSQKPAEGVQLLRNALRTDPSLADAHYYLGSGLLILQQDQEAIHEFEQAIAADPGNNRAMTSYYKLAQIYRSMHDTQDERAAMQNFLRMRARKKEQQDLYNAEVLRKRTELPVADPERIADPGQPKTP